MTKLLFLPLDHPLNGVRKDVLLNLRRAQESILETEFATAADLFERVASDLKVNLTPSDELAGYPANRLADMPINELTGLFHGAAEKAGIPSASLPLFVRLAAERVQLVSAFRDPDSIVLEVEAAVSDVVAGFPRTVDDIECGSNPGDVLDPYILSATQGLLHGGNFEGAIGTTVAHKAMMMIEDLLGHLHEDVIGAMRGNIRAPEPRGEDQETLNPQTNPFPGADVVQPPTSANEPIRFHQVKSKTGSASGGAGKRIGGQLPLLQRVYGGEIYFDALIGNTLRGHRSIGGISREAPSAIFLVGGAAFRVLTRRITGPELLLRVYQAAFRSVAASTGYSIETMAAAIVAGFKQRAIERGEDVFEVLLDDVVYANPQEQDSRTYERRRRAMPPSTTELDDGE